MAIFQAEIGLNTRRIGANTFVVLTKLHSLEDVDFSREHCHAELNNNIHRIMDRNIRNNRNRKVIEFEADIVKYFKPRENCYAETLSKIRNIKILGRA